MAQSDTALSVRDWSLSLFFNATLWHRATPLSRSSTDPFFLTPPRGTERFCSLGPRQISLFFLFFFLTPPRGIERHRSRSSTDPFFNATPWHRAILIARSATDLSLSFFFFFFFFCLWRPPVAKSDAALSVRDRSLSLSFFFFNATPWHRAPPLSRSSTDPFFF